MASPLQDATPAQAIVPAKPLDSLTVSVRELNAQGIATVYEVPMPSSPHFEDWSFFQQIAMLKAGSWQRSPAWQIAFAVAYANKLGLDINLGDVYTTGDGRIATSNKAKIKLGLATGKIDGINVETIEVEDRELDLEGYKGPELMCTVTIHVRGMSHPIVKTQCLSEWYVKSNPNWRTRPRHMLELNTTAHAMELVNPVETGDDEAPPLNAGAADAATEIVKKLAQGE